MNLRRIADAGAALLLCGFAGGLAGFFVGVSAGVLFLESAAIYSGLWGAVAGFCGGVCGIALGNRRASAMCGAYWGWYGGYNLVLGLNRAMPGNDIKISGLMAVLILFGSGVAGCLFGDLLCLIVCRPKKHWASAGWPIDLVSESTLHWMPICCRLALAFCQITPVLVCLQTMLAHLHPL